MELLELPSLLIFIYYSYSLSKKMNCDFKKCLIFETIEKDYYCRYNIAIKSKVKSVDWPLRVTFIPYLQNVLILEFHQKKTMQNQDNWK